RESFLFNESLATEFALEGPSLLFIHVFEVKAHSHLEIGLRRKALAAHVALEGFSFRIFSWQVNVRMYLESSSRRQDLPARLALVLHLIVNLLI
ncbi:hypothetical protein PMAYCL1PPCAC_10940, partial [Pristionchus mayeri]